MVPRLARLKNYSAKNRVSKPQGLVESLCARLVGETSDEIVSSVSKTRCRHRIKSRCIKARSNNNALLTRVKRRGNNKPFSGGNVILQELSFSSNTNAMYYSGYQTLQINPQDVISASSFDIKQAACAVTVSGLEQIQNS